MIIIFYRIAWPLAGRMCTSEFIFCRLVEWIEEKEISFDDIACARMCDESYAVEFVWLWALVGVQYERKP